MIRKKFNEDYFELIDTPDRTLNEFTMDFILTQTCF